MTITKDPLSIFEPVQTTALANVNARLAQEQPKTLFLVKSMEEEDNKKTKINYYMCSNIDDSSLHIIKLIGYKAEDLMLTATTWSDVVKYADEHKHKLINRSIPWQRIIYVENITYKMRK